MSETDYQPGFLESAMPISQLMAFRKTIETVQATMMKEGVHYGQVEPGSMRPCLLQPGAQILCTLFKLRPEYEIEESEPEKGHKRFRILCRLLTIQGGKPVGEGVGEGSSMESKHRFREAGQVVEDLHEPLSPGFWSVKHQSGFEAALKWLAPAYDGMRVSVKKYGPEWRVVKVISDGGERIENPNPADVFNTVLKTAKKRAFVDAVITATSSADFFTQDMEDIRENLEAVQRAIATERAELADAKGEIPKEVPADLQATVPAAKAKKAAERASKGDGAGGAPGAVESGWETIICHIGKPKGPMRGKKIGEIGDDARQWLLRTIEKKGDRASLSDIRLKKGIEEAIAEQAEKAQAEKKRKNPVAGKDEETRGVNHETLSENLDWKQISKEDFMRVAAAQKWTQATDFDGITDAEAGAMIDQIDTVFEITLAAIDKNK